MCKVGDFEIEDGVLLKYHGPGGHVVIPEGVTSIGSYAFRNCTELTGVTIPEGVRTIETAAFRCCTYLTDVTIPESVISIGSEAFANCDRLTGVSLPRGITRIPSGLFAFCESLTSVTIPESVEGIGWWAFRCCSRLTGIVIPNSVVGIGNGSFEGCCQLTNVVIPEGVIGIGYAAFNDCESLTSIRIPDSVQDIGDEAFDHCTGLADLTIPAHLAADLNRFLGKQIPPAFVLHVADITDVSAKFRPNAAAGFAVGQRDGTDESGKQYLKYIRSHAAKLAQIACVHPALLYRMIREKLITAKDLEAVTAAVQAGGNTELISAMLEYSNTCVSPQAKAKAAAEQEAREAAVTDFIFDASHLEMLEGKTFVVTGKLTTFRSRSALKECLEAVNARLEETLTGHTDFLLTNTPGSDTAKNRQAEKLGVPKITEDEFNQMIGRKGHSKML